MKRYEYIIFMFVCCVIIMVLAMMFWLLGLVGKKIPVKTYDYIQCTRDFTYTGTWQLYECPK